MSLEKADVNAALVALVGTITNERDNSLACWQRLYVVEPSWLDIVCLAYLYYREGKQAHLEDTEWLIPVLDNISPLVNSL